MALDQIQYKAVRHYKGPAMILAGPGSGKTTVITHRVWSLVKDRAVPEDNILVITFTRLAAMQMRDRYLKLGNDKDTLVCFGTFHSVFFGILKDEYGYKASDIVTSAMQRSWVKEQLLTYNSQVLDEEGLISDILAEISKVKSFMYDRHTYSTRSCEDKLFWLIFDGYVTWLKRSNMIDFDDMMVHTKQLLLKDKAVLEKWQDRFQYILVDEFQDSSPIQFDIIKLLADKYNNLFIVGDDDQSIYGFRGAAPGVMQEFKAVYPEADIYKLNINYRSTSQVVASATELINNNADRFYKDLSAYNNAGCDVIKLCFEDFEKEIGYVASRISDGTDTVILTRTNSAALNIKRTLEKAGVMAVYESKKAADNIYNHWICSDILAYINIALGCNERGLYLRIINKPVRYISRQYFIYESVDIADIVFRMRQGRQYTLVRALEALEADIRRIKLMTPFAAVNYIRKGIGYDRYIAEYCSDKGIASKEYMLILDSIAESAKGFDSLEAWLNNIQANGIRKCDTVKAGYSKRCENTRISVCTMHSSKGLEFDRVIILDVNEGEVPYNKAVTLSDIEEERRLFYVAMTRAKSELVVCYVRLKNNKPVMPSRFLKEFGNGSSL